MNRAIADALAAAPERGVQEDVMVLNMGPSHPAMHGTVRMVLTLDGETVIKCDPEIGYLHRGFEKQCENATWSQVFPYTDRLNYCSPLLNNFGYALAVGQSRLSDPGAVVGSLAYLAPERVDFHP